MATDRLKEKPGCVGDRGYQAWRKAAMHVIESRDCLVRGNFKNMHPFCWDCTPDYAGEMRAKGLCDYPELNIGPGGEQTADRVCQRYTFPVVGEKVGGGETLEFSDAYEANKYFVEIGVSNCLRNSNIHRAIRGAAKSAYGYVWKRGQKNARRGNPGIKHSEEYSVVIRTET